MAEELVVFIGVRAGRDVDAGDAAGEERRGGGRRVVEVDGGLAGKGEPPIGGAESETIGAPWSLRVFEGVALFHGSPTFSGLEFRDGIQV